MLDVIIVGAGPAGLNAALVLGRCRRQTLVLDSGRPRNSTASAMWGFLSRDGVDPHELLRIGREQLRPYDTVELQAAEVVNAERREDGTFEITLRDETKLAARKLLLATGVVDEIPEIAGIEIFYGESVQHCPYCHGWEVRDQPIVIYGKGPDAARFALEMTCWSRDLVLCTDGPANLRDKDRRRLRQRDIPVREEQIARLEGDGRMLERVVFANGDVLECTSLFFHTGQRQHSDLVVTLGCEFTPEGSVATDDHEATRVPGLYVAGDASRRAQFAIISAAEGTLAAIAINTALIREDLAREDSREVSA